MADQLDPDGLPIWAAPERNKRPILEQLQRLLPKTGGTFLEIASGTGQHAAYFADALPHFVFLTSDVDDAHLDTLRRRAELGRWPNLRPPVRLDVRATDWPVSSPDVIYAANLVHIAPLAAAEGLFRGAGQRLASGGLLLTYGPYRVGGRHTSESNEAFDASLRERDPSFGVRDVAELTGYAAASGLDLEERVPMPANNFLLVFRKA